MDSFGALLLPLIVIAVFLLLMIPQRRAQQRHRTLVSQLKAGDDVVTMGGVYGTITEVEDDETVLLEIAEDTDIRVAKASIGRVIASRPAEPADDPAPAGDVTPE